MGLWHDIKVRLGLESDWDEEYDDDYHDPDAEENSDSGDGFYGRSAYQSDSGRKPARDYEMERPGRDRDHLRSVPSVTPAVGSATATPQVKMHIVEPKSFSEAQSIADKFKKGTPVIMNMTMTQPDVAKRMIDFASGLTYGLDGGLQKISDRVFMLTPANVDVSAGEFKRLRDNGLFTVE